MPSTATDAAGDRREQTPVADSAAPARFGLTTAIALIIGAIIGVGISIVFIVYSRNTGHSFWVYWAPFLLAAAAMLAGIPIYQNTRRHMTEPEPMPPYPTIRR